MIKGFVRNNLSCSKVVFASSHQEKCSEALRSLKNGSPFSPRHDIKRAESNHVACKLLYVLCASWQFAAGGGVYNLIYLRQTEGVFRAVFVKISVINTHSPFFILFLNENMVC